MSNTAAPQLPDLPVGSSEDHIVWLKQMTARLVSLPHRGSGTRFERLAGAWVKNLVESMGATVVTQEFLAQSSYGLRILVHFALAIAALALAWLSPVVSMLATVTVLFSFLAETSGYPNGMSRIFLKTRSGNLVATFCAQKEPRQRLVVSAHIDTQHSGWIWNDRLMMKYCQMVETLPAPLRAPMFWFSAALLTQIGLTLLLVLGVTVPYSMGALATLYVAGIIVTGQWASGEFVPGANDNATGVVAAIDQARRWIASGPHEHTELVLLITGCEEAGVVGAAIWADQNRETIDAIPTRFVNLDLLGCSHVHFLKEETGLCGTIVSYPQSLLTICSRKAHDLGMSTDPHSIPTQTDGIAFLIRGMLGITITSSEQGAFVPHYHTMDDTLENVNFDAVELASDFAWNVLNALDASLDSASACQAI